MFEHILVPLDGSTAAEIVFPYVIEIASMFNSGISLARVTESASPAVKEECRSYLEGAALQIKSLLISWGTNGNSTVQIRVLSGNPAIEILKYAAETSTGLIAVASRGASSEGPWPLGNIAAKILRASSFPVLLVRKQPENAKMIQKKLFQKILAPLDGSRLGEAALPLATALSTKTGAEIVLFRVVEPVAAFAGPTGEIAWNFMSNYEKNARMPVMSYLERTKDSLDKNLPGVSTAMGEGFPANEIIDYADVNNVDLIAMSTHGRSGLGRWVYGSITEKVLHSGDQPVLVVRPKAG